MSATGRNSKDGTKTKRNPNDFYITPEWCTHRLLEKTKNRLNPGIWLEPCAGSGAIITAAKKFGIYSQFTAVELQEKFEKRLCHQTENVIIGDFLSWEPKVKYQVAIGNPPYGIAQKIIEHSIKVSEQTCMLLRLNFLSSAKRQPWIKSNTPDVYILPNRPSFTGKGTDASEYAWFLWDGKSNGKITILDLTPKNIRAEEKTLAKERQKTMFDV